MVMPRPLPKDCRSGFALLITITLLAFLVLLLVSLASLTRIETQVAANSQQLSQARQNALMAINIALGRLQSLAGPDQRITATADLIAGVDNTKRRWTGVWNTTAATPSPEWLVSTASGTAPTGTTTSINTAIVATGTVPLVGDKSTDTSVPGNAVTVETQPITATVPGLPGPQTIGNFAYWVGDEGVKAKVNLNDPGAASTATAAEKTYRFINAQRIGIEGVDSAAAGTPLSTGYPANATDLPKILELKQLSMLSTGGQAALTTAAKNRFHDLTATSCSVLADVSKGGLKKDLTAWIFDPAAPSNPVSANAADDYITPGDTTDTGKYGLPKWALIRSYATTYGYAGMPTALAPRQQTDSQQGVSPVITYVRMGYNYTCPAGGGIYKINIMPVLALWNPYNVPLPKSTNASNSYEVCFSYTPNIAGSAGCRLKTVIYASGSNPGTEYFNLSTIQMQLVNYGSSGATIGQFWRFKVTLSKPLDPGESRLFTISNTSNDTIYNANGLSEMSDDVLGVANAVYIPSAIALTPDQMAGHIFWNTETGSLTALTQILLTQPGLTTDQDRRDKAYQKILGNGFNWSHETNPYVNPTVTNNGDPIVCDRVELVMSNTGPAAGPVGANTNSGTPRWLAELNPHAAVSLRLPVASGSSVTPSYVREHYIRSTPNGYPSAPPAIPNANGTNVSAGPKIETTSTDQRMVLREFQRDPTTLISLGQLQHVNASLINLNPAFPIGNSLPNLYVPRTATQSALLPADAYPGFPTNTQFQHVYDLSYLLNKTLWDGYFFSTVPQTVAATGQTALSTAQAKDPDYHLPNARHRFYWKTGSANDTEVDEFKAVNQGATKAAAHLLLSGGFNVNSTSEQAWRALLYSHNGIANDTADTTGKTKHPYSRLAVPVDTTQPNTTWLGYRILSDDQITTLATAIVAEVRKRGPFLSLADFVNRRLVADATGLKGPLQAAIDATTTGANSINGGAPFNFSTMPVTDYPADIVGDTEQKAIYLGGTDSALPSASRATSAPGSFTQADLLNALGPSLTARSDTFRIRAYGDVINPVNGGTTPEARAWCEAIVQRLPDYVETSVNASAIPSSGSLSETFGRRFKIVSFRWLSSNDI